MRTLKKIFFSIFYNLSSYLKLKFDRLIPVIFLILTLFFVKPYVFNHKVPLPFNLLVSFYPPWKYEKWNGFESGVPNKPLGQDNLKLFYPLRKFTVEQLKLGKLPLWNPYVFAGNVHLATYQSAVFYPLNIFYQFLSMIDAWSVIFISQPILAGWFTYLFLRSLKLSKKSSLLGSIAFAFSGWMLAVWEYTLVVGQSILWLPLALYASNLIWNGSKQKLGFILLVVALTCSALAGFTQTTIYLVLTFIFWNIYLCMQNIKNNNFQKPVVILTSASLVSLFITAVQWAPAAEAYLLSARRTVDMRYLFEVFLSPFWYLITFLVPDFWGNPGTYNYFSPLIYVEERVIFTSILVFILALSTYFRKSLEHEKFWKYFTVITLSLGLNVPTSWIWYQFKVPVLSLVQPARIFILSTLGICVLAAYASEYLFKGKKWSSIKAPITISSVVIFILWIFVLLMNIFKSNLINFVSMCNVKDNHFLRICSLIVDPKVQRQIVNYATISLRNLVIPTLVIISILLIYKFARFNRILTWSLFYVIIFTSSLYFGTKLLYFSERNFEYPDHPALAKLKELAKLDRVWSYGDAYVYRNILSYFGLYSAEGYDALYPRRFGELMNSIRTYGTISDQFTRNDADLSETGQYELMERNPYRLKLMSLTGTKYILEYKLKDETDPLLRFPNNLFSLAWQNDKWRIWQYLNSLPRAFLVHDFIIEKDRQKIANLIYNPKIDLSKKVILEEDFKDFDLGNLNEFSLQANNSQVEIIKYDPSEIRFNVTTESSGFLFLSDTFYPGWKALVDGKETKIYRANYAFRAVPVKAGSHKIIFVYDPVSFKISLFISGLGLLLFIIIIRSKNLIRK